MFEPQTSTTYTANFNDFYMFILITMQHIFCVQIATSHQKKKPKNQKFSWEEELPFMTFRQLVLVHEHITRR